MYMAMSCTRIALVPRNLASTSCRYISGTLMYLQEVDATFRGTSAILVHDIAMYIAIPLVIGHLYMAMVNPSTRHSLRGMVLGTVRRDWAREHHAKWEREL